MVIARCGCNCAHRHMCCVCLVASFAFGMRMLQQQNETYRYRLLERSHLTMRNTAKHQTRRSTCCRRMCESPRDGTNTLQHGVAASMNFRTTCTGKCRATGIAGTDHMETPSGYSPPPRRPPTSAACKCRVGMHQPDSRLVLCPSAPRNRPACVHMGSGPPGIVSLKRVSPSRLQGQRHSARRRRQRTSACTERASPSRRRAPTHPVDRRTARRGARGGSGA
ncbi:hypothetical protein PF002_g9052 [Phytophthora fragariae]|uniref:Secreted protein n=1 Tax=Phytophthora fragariae TaxID=53985 RepID=A0A6A3F6B1_9STRA|nr:hypothetical protein PF009_g8674 [Phytophthora fragariae]KAE9123278.1 hypothetical protein PF007_g7121 [Phytophthora fragariae]KAE9241859.1 hypothetical protein PF002_g9052 [Phytophthora fragariae]